MAEIKGVTLKGLTRFVGMEGEAYRGNIYQFLREYPPPLKVGG